MFQFPSAPQRRLARAAAAVASMLALALPVAAENEDTRVLTGSLCVTTTCYGPYTKLSETYTRGIEWLQQNGYALASPPYEQYVTGPDTVKSPDDFITQVYFPVKKV